MGDLSIVHSADCFAEVFYKLSFCFQVFNFVKMAFGIQEEIQVVCIFDFESNQEVFCFEWAMIKVAYCNNRWNRKTMLGKH